MVEGEQGFGRVVGHLAAEVVLAALLDPIEQSAVCAEDGHGKCFAGGGFGYDRVIAWPVGRGDEQANRA